MFYSPAIAERPAILPQYGKRKRLSSSDYTALVGRVAAN